MNTAYYYEIHKKSQDSMRNYDDSITEESTPIRNDTLHDERNLLTSFGGEHVLSEYEIMSNDDIETDNEEIVDLTSRNSNNQLGIETVFPNFNTSTEPYKLQLNLNTTKIALKSQTTKINKSILPETDVTYEKQTRECKTAKAQHVPLPFSILPLSNTTTTDSMCDGTNESNNLPEIVLTSFEMHDNAMGTRRTMKKSATVTFQAVTPQTTTTITDTQVSSTVVNTFCHMVPRETSHQKQLPHSFAKIPTLLPPPSSVTTQSTEGNIRQQEAHQPNNGNVKAYKNPSTTTTTTTTIANFYDRFRRDSEDSSEIYSQQGGGESSTSPESLMDTILSAASSVSVCDSSTNSISLVDNAKIHANKELDIHRQDDGIAVHIGSTKTTTSTEATNVGRRETFFNSSSNLKSKPFFSTPPTFMTTSSANTPTSHSATTALHSEVTPVSTARIGESQVWLHPPDHIATLSIMRSRTPSPTPSIRILPERALYPDELKCQICSEPFTDPRTLNCLHSFCFQCLVNENFNQDKSIPFWSQPNEPNPSTVATNENNERKSSEKSNYSYRSLSPDITFHSTMSETGSSPSRQRRTSFSFRRKKSQDRIPLKSKSDGRTSEYSSTVRLSTLPYDTEKKVEEECENVRFVLCKKCNFATQLPIGGLRQLPQNFVLIRKIEEVKLKAGDDIISHIFCSLCFEETNATYHCLSCTINLCSLCKEAHERQRTTANHKIKNIMELRRLRKNQQTMVDDSEKFTLKCGMHPGFEIKSFCTVCLQVACADCLVLLHKGHKYETISRAITNYNKLLNNSLEQTRPLCNFAEHTIDRLSGIVRDINRKCDEIQTAVDTFIQQYSEALQAHHKTLLQQVSRARESKIENLLEKQLDIEKRSGEIQEAIRFCQELRELASDVEVLSFVNILLKRFEYCQQFKMPIDPKISDSLHFLPKIIAPSTKEQNNITLYGIITMQTVEPMLCTLQDVEFSQLRLHKRVELTIWTRDADGVPLCHGGMLKQIQVTLKNKETSTKTLPFDLSDNRDGTYTIAFTPDSQGTLILSIYINDKPIKGSPYTFLARSVRPHSGIFHCCSFCSSGKAKGSKSVKCSCEGRMPGYNGCGHGHPGHPGRRHWSCCGNVLENSECNVANKLLNT